MTPTSLYCQFLNNLLQFNNFHGFPWSIYSFTPFSSTICETCYVNNGTETEEKNIQLLNLGGLSMLHLLSWLRFCYQLPVWFGLGITTRLHHTASLLRLTMTFFKILFHFSIEMVRRQILATRKEKVVQWLAETNDTVLGLN